MDQEQTFEPSGGLTGSLTGVPHPGPAQFRLVSPPEGSCITLLQGHGPCRPPRPAVTARYLAAIESQDRATHPFFHHDLQLFLLFINDFLASTGGVAAGLPT